MIWKI